MASGGNGGNQILKVPLMSVTFQTLRRNVNKLFLKVVGQGRFSDVIVKCFSKRYPLHRIILIQSPFFKRIFLDDDKCKEINLEIENDDRLCVEGLEVNSRYVTFNR